MRVYGGQQASEFAQLLNARHQLSLEKWDVMQAQAALLGQHPGERPKSIWEQLIEHIRRFNAEPGVCHAMVALFINRLLHDHGSIEDAWPTEAEAAWLADRLQRIQKEYQLESMKLKVQSPNMNRGGALKKATNRMMKSPERTAEGLKFELRYQVLLDEHNKPPAVMPWTTIFENVRHHKLCLLSIYI